MTTSKNCNAMHKLATWQVAFKASTFSRITETTWRLRLIDRLGDNARLPH